MKKVLFVFLVLFIWHCQKPKITANLEQKSAMTQMREIIGSANCDTMIYENGDTIYGYPDHHVNTTYFFRGKENGFRAFDYKMNLNNAYETPRVDTGSFLLKCLDYQSLSQEELHDLIDTFLVSKLKTLLPNKGGLIDEFSKKRVTHFKSALSYLQNKEKILTKKELDSFSYNWFYRNVVGGDYFASRALNSYNLVSFKNKDTVEKYCQLSQPIVNLQNTICYLSVDCYCNTNDECGGGIFYVLQKQSGEWKIIHTGGWES